MEWKAQWIWGGEEASPRNEWRCFRKTFRMSGDRWDRARLSITADSRYVLFVNGERIGRGPVRCWPFEQAYDTYEIGHVLKPDEDNTIAVFVMHFGISTYSYIRGRGGLLAQLDAEESGRALEAVVVSDGSWRTERHLGHNSRAPRMSFQQAFAEKIDARRWDDRWAMPGFDDASWRQASAIGEAGMEPWTTLVPRDIPYLTEAREYPVRVESLQAVVPISWTAIIDMRAQMTEGGENHMNAYGYAGYAAVVIRVSEPFRAEIGFTYRAPNVHCLLINGERIPKERLASTGKVEAALRRGDNLVMIELIGHDHGRGLFLGIDCGCPFELVSPVPGASGNDSPFVSIGPFHLYEYIDHQYGEAEQAKHQAALNCGAHDREHPAPADAQSEAFRAVGSARSSEELIPYSAWIRSIPAALVSPDALISLSSWKRESMEHSVPVSLQQAVMPHGIPGKIPVFEDADTELIVDFGREVSGFLSFELDAAEGTVIDLYGFEYMRDGWIQHMHYLENSIRYICREGRQRYASPIRRGFRYAMLTVRNASRPVRLYDLHTVVSHYPVAEIGQFQSSDALLNEIWNISKHTTKLCMEDTFVDCPSFEQAFWVGDSRNEALIAYYLFGGEELVKRCLRLVPGSNGQTPLYLDQVPSGFNSVIPNWTFFWVVACLEYYHRTNDREFAVSMWPHVRHTLQHYMERLDERGLLFMHAWNFLDWAPIDQPRHGAVSHQNMFLVKALRAAAELADLAEQPEEGAALREQAKELTDAINTQLWSEERDAYLDCIHGDGRHSDIFSMQTQVVALLCGIATEERRAKLASYLTAPPSSFVPIGSPFMSFFYYEALAQAGAYDALLKDLREQYGRMVEYGASTCWEMYPKPDKDGHLPKQLTRSHCHAWSAAPPYFLGAYVLGVRSGAPGWRKVVVEPQPCGLAWARGSVPLPETGRVDVSWRLSGTSMELEIRAPKHVTVDARLPQGYDGSIRQITVG